MKTLGRHLKDYIAGQHGLPRSRKNNAPGDWA